MPSFPGWKVTRFLGMVSGTAVVEPQGMCETATGAVEIGAGWGDAYMRSLTEANDVALDRMREEAKRCDADAVLSCAVQVSMIRSVIVVFAVGTAVAIELEDGDNV